MEPWIIFILVWVPSAVASYAIFRKWIFTESDGTFELFDKGASAGISLAGGPIIVAIFLLWILLVVLSRPLWRPGEWALKKLP